jgi:hypothetical protein
MVKLVRTREKGGGGNAESLGDPPDIQETDVALAALHASYVCSVETSQVCELFLGITESLSPRSNLLTECDPRIHERPIVEFRAGCRLQTISSFNIVTRVDVKPGCISFANVRR